MRITSQWQARFTATADPDFLEQFRRWMPTRIVEERVQAAAQDGDYFVWAMVHEGDGWEQLAIDLISAAQDCASTVDASLQLVGTVQEAVLINLRPRPAGLLAACKIEIVTCELHRADLSAGQVAPGGQ